MPLCIPVTKKRYSNLAGLSVFWLKIFGLTNKIFVSSQNYWKYFEYLCLKTSKGTSCLRISKLTFSYFLNSCSNFEAKIFEIGHCVLEIRQIYWGCHNRLVKSWFWEKGSWNLEICTKYWYFGNSEVNFDTKTLFLHQILQVIWRLSIEESKICEISKSTLRLYFEIFWLCIPITQNLVFRQLVPFNMLSHIYMVKHLISRMCDEISTKSNQFVDRSIHFNNSSLCKEC